MNWSVSFLLLAGIPTVDPPAHPDQNVFQNYAKAWSEARIVQRPLLVILNPAEDADADLVRLDELCRTRERRRLLGEYVLAVIDTGTDHGRKVHKLFNEAPLPQVVVIDKRQQYQIFKTADGLYDRRWTEILQRYRNGEPLAVNTRSTGIHGEYSGGYYSGQYCPT